MSVQTYQVGNALLLSYPMAGPGMRYIEVNVRKVHLRNVADRGLILRGEVPDCGPNCYIDLSQILLEYALNCGGCKDGLIAEEMADQFGQNLGKALLTKLPIGLSEAAVADRLSDVFKIILDSMNVPFVPTQASDSLRYDLAHCPIHLAAKSGGLSLGIGRAHRIFVALCECILSNLAADWTLVEPSERETQEQLLEIHMVKI